jgi:hypothetical protein
MQFPDSLGAVSLYPAGMKSSLLLLCLTSWFLASCKTERHVENDSLNRTRIGDDRMLEDKFAGNWKPEDAAWYSAPGETDKKKIAEREKSVKRSQFEKVLSGSRAKKDEKTPNQWDKRANYEKEWAGTKEKKTFEWPWQKPDVKTKQSNLKKEYAGQERTSKEGSQVAREETETNRDSRKSYATEDYDSHRPEIKKTEQWQAAKPEMHHGLNIIEDRDKPKKDSGWSVSDVRKFLNKD